MPLFGIIPVVTLFAVCAGAVTETTNINKTKPNNLTKLTPGSGRFLCHLNKKRIGPTLQLLRSTEGKQYCNQVTGVQV